MNHPCICSLAKLGNPMWCCPENCPALIVVHQCQRTLLSGCFERCPDLVVCQPWHPFARWRTMNYFWMVDLAIQPSTRWWRRSWAERYAKMQHYRRIGSTKGSKIWSAQRRRGRRRERSPPPPPLPPAWWTQICAARIFALLTNTRGRETRNAEVAISAFVFDRLGRESEHSRIWFNLRKTWSR